MRLEEEVRAGGDGGDWRSMKELKLSGFRE